MALKLESVHDVVLPTCTGTCFCSNHHTHTHTHTHTLTGLALDRSKLPAPLAFVGHVIGTLTDFGLGARSCVLVTPNELSIP